MDHTSRRPNAPHVLQQSQQTNPKLEQVSKVRNSSFLNSQTMRLSDKTKKESQTLSNVQMRLHQMRGQILNKLRSFASSILWLRKISIRFKVLSRLRAQPAQIFPRLSRLLLSQTRAFRQKLRHQQIRQFSSMGLLLSLSKLKDRQIRSAKRLKALKIEG